MFFSTFFLLLLNYNINGDIMRKYYLFIIKNDFSKVYKNNAHTLYVTLDNIYKLKNRNFIYGISIYNQLCQVFDADIIDNYLSNKSKKYIKKYHNKFFINDVYAREKTCIQVNHSCIVIKTNSNIPYALRIFSWYSNNIFVCDFVNNDYFWLSDYTTSKINYEYCL